MWKLLSASPVELLISDAEVKGRGVFAVQNLPKGKLVREYIGELISASEHSRRQARGRCYYVMKLGVNLFIDATSCVNHARLFNHSCRPNCIAEMWTVRGAKRVGLFTIRAIKSGEELTFDYGPGFIIDKCQCQSCIHQS